MITQPFLPLSGDAATAAIDNTRLRAARRDAERGERPRMRGKRLELLCAIQSAPRGLTMREMAAISGRGINCWTQPFTDLRQWGVIHTTDERRDGGTVHVLSRSITVAPNGDWE
jgi:hypothetical protein